MNAQHTPTPWRIDPDSDTDIQTASGEPIGGFTTAEYATRAVRACNAHDDLVAALKSAKMELEVAASYLNGRGHHCIAGHCEDEVLRLNAALAKAGAA